MRKTFGKSVLGKILHIIFERVRTEQDTEMSSAFCLDLVLDPSRTESCKSTSIHEFLHDWKCCVFEDSPLDLTDDVKVFHARELTKCAFRVADV